MSAIASHILPTRVVSGLYVTSEQCGDVASIIVSRDPHDYIKVSVLKNGLIAADRCSDPE